MIYHIRKKQARRMIGLGVFLFLLMTIWIIYQFGGGTSDIGKKIFAVDRKVQKKIQKPTVPKHEEPVKNIKEPKKGEKQREIQHSTKAAEVKSAAEVHKAGETLDSKGVKEDKSGLDLTGFNKYVSDRIPLDRDVPDTSPPSCKTMFYYWDDVVRALPELSVVIPVRNEPRSTLLRSVTSLLKRTRADKLKEVILIDDASTYDETKTALKEALKLSKKVKVLHLKMALGTNKARALGLYNAIGEVIFTTDAHVEFGHGWAEPLLYELPIASDKVVCPTLDVIHRNTFAYSAVQAHQPKYAFGMNFFLDIVPMYNTPSQEEKFQRTYLAIQEPAAGVHFALRKSFYNKLGKLSLLETGADVEISLMAGLCGGGVYRSPCSRLGHLNRDPLLSPDADSKVDHVASMRGKARLAKIWMGQHAKIFCSRFKPEICQNISLPSLAVMDPKSCETFDSYLSSGMMFVPKDLQAHGQLLNTANGTEACLAMDVWTLTGTPKLEKCLPQIIARRQYFMLTVTGEFRQDNGCLSNFRGRPRKMKCTGREIWKFKDSTLKHIASVKCLTRIGRGLRLQTCTEGSKKQLWNFKSPTQ